MPSRNRRGYTRRDDERDVRMGYEAVRQRTDGCSSMAEPVQVGRDRVTAKRVGQPALDGTHDDVLFPAAVADDDGGPTSQDRVERHGHGLDRQLRTGGSPFDL